MRLVEDQKITRSVPGFAERVAQESGQPIEACYQCGKCTAGCPLASVMDMKPNQVIRAVQLGLEDTVLDCNAVWHCSGCETCFSRCPRNIDMSRVNKALARLCVLGGRKPRDPAVATFHKAFLESMGRWGRAHEVEVLSLTKLREASQRLKDLRLGAVLFEKGRLGLLPSWVRKSRDVRRILADSEARARTTQETEP